MLILNKNGINFVVDLVWQRQNDENKIKLSYLKKICKFDLYCKANIAVPTFGFLKITPLSDKQKYLSKMKNPVSLALFVIASSDLDRSIDDVFICFRFDENNIGYILIYKGSIFPNKGEFIGSEDVVKSRIIALSRELDIKHARICDDVQLHNNPNFAVEANLQIVSISSYDKFGNKINIGASDYYLWNKHKFFNSRLRKARLKPLTFLSPKRVFALSAILLLTIILFVTHIYKERINSQIFQISKKSRGLKYQNTVGVNPRIFLDGCFYSIDWFLNGLTTMTFDHFACSLLFEEGSYKYTGATNSTLALKNVVRSIFGSQTIWQQGNDGIVVGRKLNLNLLHPDIRNDSVAMQRVVLDRLAKKYGFTVQYFGKNGVDIISRTSPLYLYKQSVFEVINILQIDMKPDSSGFYVWNIKGSLSGNHV